MLRPSYNELMDRLNVANDTDNQISSGYSIVIAAAKRARQIINGAQPLTVAATDRAVSIAIQEMVEGKLTVHASEEDLERLEEARRYGSISKQFGVMEIDTAAYDESALKPQKPYSSDDEDNGEDELEAGGSDYLVEDEEGNVYRADAKEEPEEAEPEEELAEEDEEYDYAAEDGEAAAVEEYDGEDLELPDEDGDLDTDEDYGDGDEE